MDWKCQLHKKRFLALNFHSLEVVSRYRDPQLQVSENYSDLIKWRIIRNTGVLIFLDRALWQGREHVGE